MICNDLVRAISSFRLALVAATLTLSVRGSQDVPSFKRLFLPTFLFRKQGVTLPSPGMPARRGYRTTGLPMPSLYHQYGALAASKWRESTELFVRYPYHFEINVCQMFRYIKIIFFELDFPQATLFSCRKSYYSVSYKNVKQCARLRGIANADNSPGCA